MAAADLETWSASSRAVSSVVVSSLMVVVAMDLALVVRAWLEALRVVCLEEESSLGVMEEDMADHLVGIHLEVVLVD